MQVAPGTSASLPQIGVCRPSYAVVMALGVLAFLGGPGVGASCVSMQRHKSCWAATYAQDVINQLKKEVNMQTPETRVINQCTHTPVKPIDGENLTIQQPFLKQGILATVFDDPEMSKVVLERIVALKHEEWPDRPEIYEDLVKAVAAMWRGDLATSITSLREVEMEQVARFARKALELERSALERAQQDLHEAASSVTRRTEAEVERVSELHREVAAMRDSIMAEVRGMVASPIAEARQSTRESPELASTVRVGLPETTMTKASRVAPDSVPIRTTITPDMVRAEMIERMPQSANFLENIRFFASPLALTAMPVAVQQLSVKLEHTAQKTQTVETLLENAVVEPLGYLHLERLQFTPLGYEKGELVYSLPLLPGETVRLSHREWSRTETEYTKLIETQLETATEEALSEKSELAQASSTQQQHSSAFNTSVNASGGYGSFNISTSVGYSSSNSESQSRQFATKHAQEITKKATSRAKKDCKVTFKVATAYELEDQQYREISNPLKRAVRYDFHRLMKKWRIDLYRYDIRLTYDIVIPEPGSYLLRKYILLRAINEELAKPNAFALSPTVISDDETSQPLTTHWTTLAKDYGVSLDFPPLRQIERKVTQEFTYTKQHKDANIAHYVGYVDVDLPEGYEFERIEKIASHNAITLDQGKDAIAIEPLIENKDAIFKGTRHVRLGYLCWFNANAREGMTVSTDLEVVGKRTSECFRQWQMECFEKLKDAAATSYEARVIRLTKIRDALESELSREDALMLRKLEREELMKGVLRWLLGPKFRFYPQNQAGLKLPDLILPTIDLSAADISSLEDVALLYYDPLTQSVKEDYRASALQYGELIKFLHQAIEWENINYVLYPYFWTYPDKKRWDFKQSLYHSDYVHRSFLRAGAARVVLTIRPGFEPDFLSLMEGHIGELLPPNHQYMTVADELKAVATTNYPYTQDANVEKEEYMFTWEKVPGAEEDRLKRCLRQSFYVSWAEGYRYTVKKNQSKVTFPTIAKSADKNTITVSIYHDPPQGPLSAKIEGSVELELVKENNNVVAVTLKITNGKTYELKVKEDNNLHKVYREQNLVDTWYEFTPTGALDVEVGKISDVLEADDE